MGCSKPSLPNELLGFMTAWVKMSSIGLCALLSLGDKSLVHVHVNSVLRAVFRTSPTLMSHRISQGASVHIAIHCKYLQGMAAVCQNAPRKLGWLSGAYPGIASFFHFRSCGCWWPACSWPVAVKDLEVQSLLPQGLPQGHAVTLSITCPSMCGRHRGEARVDTQ